MAKKRKSLKHSPLSPSLSCSVSHAPDDYSEEYGTVKNKIKEWLTDGFYWNRRKLILFTVFLIYIAYLREIVDFISKINITFE